VNANIEIHIKASLSLNILVVCDVAHSFGNQQALNINTPVAVFLVVCDPAMNEL
jgi:hypothetical protein